MVSAVAVSVRRVSSSGTDSASRVATARTQRSASGRRRGVEQPGHHDGGDAEQHAAEREQRVLGRPGRCLRHLGGGDGGAARWRGGVGPPWRRARRGRRARPWSESVAGAASDGGRSAGASGAWLCAGWVVGLGLARWRWVGIRALASRVSWRISDDFSASASACNRARSARRSDWSLARRRDSRSSPVEALVQLGERGRLRVMRPAAAAASGGLVGHAPARRAGVGVHDRHCAKRTVAAPRLTA